MYFDYLLREQKLCNLMVGCTDGENLAVMKEKEIYKYLEFFCGLEQKGPKCKN